MNNTSADAASHAGQEEGRCPSTPPPQDRGESGSKGPERQSPGDRGTSLEQGADQAMRSLTREGQAFVLQTLDAHKCDDEGRMATIEAQARLRPFQERQAADVSAPLAEVSLSVAPAAPRPGSLPPPSYSSASSRLAMHWLRPPRDLGVRLRTMMHPQTRPLLAAP